MIKSKIKGILFLCSTILMMKAGAQQNLSLKSLLQVAETNYPLLKSKIFSAKAAEQNITAAKKSLIPSVDASYQANYATYNNITGMAYPSFLIPISGPPTASNTYNGVFGSAASLLLNWQPVTFGYRNTQIEYAKKTAGTASADVNNEIFQHKIKIINTYLDLAVANELIKVFENNVKRNEADLKTASVLVMNGIKPGVDTALFKSELSKSKIDLLNAKNYRDKELIYLSQLVNFNNISIVIDSVYFKRLPQLGLLDKDSVQNPGITLYKSIIESSEAYKKVLSKSSMPTLNTWATTYARGSGISNTGDINSLEGLGLQRVNYGIGIQLSFPILQSVKNKPQIQQQDFTIQSNQEKLNELELVLQKQNELADATLNKSLEVVKESPQYLQSALFSYNSMQSRYSSGLASISDLLQTQNALIKAETEYRLTFMEVWKAFLFKVIVKGDLNVFLNQVN